MRRGQFLRMATSFKWAEPPGAPFTSNVSISIALKNPSVIFSTKHPEWLGEPAQAERAAGTQAQLLKRVFGEQFEVLAGKPAPLENCTMAPEAISTSLPERGAKLHLRKR